MSVTASDKCMGIVDICNARLAVPKVNQVWDVRSKLPSAIFINFSRVLGERITSSTDDPPSLGSSASATLMSWINKAREGFPDDLAVIQLKAVSDNLISNQILSTTNGYFSINDIPNRTGHLQRVVWNWTIDTVAAFNLERVRFEVKQFDSCVPAV